MIYIGIDDTDTLETPGTNQLARKLVQQVQGRYRSVQIVRHQLLDDPRVPYTSKNGSASILLEPLAEHDADWLIRELRGEMLRWFVPGSDPGLCVTDSVPDPVRAFGELCQREVVTQPRARALAAECGIFLEGLGGTQGGVIGALAAIGLVAPGNDGRVVQIGTWPDDLSGPQEIGALAARDVEVRDLETNVAIASGLVNVGKHLRPNLRGGRYVQFVRPCLEGEWAAWEAVRLT
jgi:hypothetical protein